MTVTRTATGQIIVHPETVTLKLHNLSHLMDKVLADSGLPEPVKTLYLQRYAEQFDTLLRLASAGHDMSSAITMMDATVRYAIGLRTEPKLAQQAFFIGLAFFNSEYRHESAT